MKLIQVGGHHKDSEPMWSMVDDDDYEKLSQFNWSILRKKHTNYATSKNRTIFMHRLIMGLEYGDKRVINHIDGNGLNNQRANLEICTNMYNTQSINKPNSNKGNVRFLKDYCRQKPWRAEIRINKVRHVKYFATEQEGDKFIEETIEQNKHLIIPN